MFNCIVCTYVLTRSYDRPKMIELLQGKHMKEIACGSGHSAAITTNGELYTWGQGEHGRLGHGDTNSRSKPKLVRQSSYRIHMWQSQVENEH